jgi:hypothetical protein
MDFAIALILFTLTLVLYSNYSVNLQKQEEGDLEKLIVDIQSISSNLALSGYPNNWTASNVVRIGIADEQRINISKLKNFKKLDYKTTKSKLGTAYDYFIFFLNDQGQVLNINGVCGVGSQLVNTSFGIKSAYYYQDPSDAFLKDFMQNNFKADIYFDDDPDNVDDIDGLVSNLSKYSFLVMEHPLMTAAKYGNYKDDFESFVSAGNFFMISGELTTSQGQDMIGADFFKKSGQAESDRNATVNTTDKYLSFNIGDNIVFAQAYYIENLSSSSQFTILASFNQDGRNAAAKWEYDNGTAYFFSDFDVSFFNGNFTQVIEDLASGLVEGTCNPLNLSGIDQEKLIKTERYLIHNSKVIKMVVYLWQ